MENEDIMKEVKEGGDTLFMESRKLTDDPMVATMMMGKALSDMVNNGIMACAQSNAQNVASDLVSILTDIQNVAFRTLANQFGHAIASVIISELSGMPVVYTSGGNRA